MLIAFDHAFVDIAFIKLGIASSEFPFLERPPRDPAQPLRTLFVGALWAGKGPLTAVEAHALLVRSGIPAHLDVCGDGAPGFVAALQRLIHERGVADSVTQSRFSTPRARRRRRRGCETAQLHAPAGQTQAPAHSFTTSPVA